MPPQGLRPPIFLANNTSDSLFLQQNHWHDLYDGLAGGNTDCSEGMQYHYVRVLPKELLRLRSLIARGRAREKVRTRTKTPREIALLFAPAFPNELFWKVSEYWNPRS